MDTPRILRDCLKPLLEQGSPQTEAWHHAYLLAKEFKRLGWTLEKATGEIVNWAGRCNPPLMGNQIESVKKSVRKVYCKNDSPLSCAAGKFLKNNGYCILKSSDDRTCEFNNAVQLAKEFNKAKNIPEEGWQKWEAYFQLHNPKLSRYLILFYIILKKTEIERGIPQGGPIFIGFRAIKNMILTQYRNHNPGLETLSTCSRILEWEGLIKVTRVPKNKRGPHCKKANGYHRVVPLPCPPERSLKPFTHNTQIMCSGEQEYIMCVPHGDVVKNGKPA